MCSHCVLGFVFVFLRWSSTDARYDYKLSTENVTWHQAHKSCEELGDYTLADPSLLSESSLFDSLNQTEGDPYWTNNYYMKTEFYWKLGCYITESQMESSPDSLGNTNSLAACIHDCENPKYIGLEQNKCHCFHSRPSLGRQSNTPCNTECPGNPRDTCGNSNRISIYRMLISDIDGITIDDTNDCVTVNKEDVENYYDYNEDEFQIITSSPCSQKKGYICESVKPDKKTGSVHHPFQEKVTWFQADRNCINAGMKLAFIDSTNAPGLAARDDIMPGSYWIGLYRQKFIIAGHVKTSVKPYKCQGIQTKSQGYDFSEENCETKRRSLCQKHIPDISTVKHLDNEPTPSEEPSEISSPESSSSEINANNSAISVNGVLHVYKVMLTAIVFCFSTSVFHSRQLAGV